MMTSLSYCLPDIVVACTQAAAQSGKKLSWTLKENARGTLVQLVWKHRHQEFASPEVVCITKNYKNCIPKKRKKYSPSRQRRSHECLLRFISHKQEEGHKREEYRQQVISFMNGSRSGRHLSARSGSFLKVPNLVDIFLPDL